MILLLQISDLHIAGRVDGVGQYRPQPARQPSENGALSMRGHDFLVAHQLGTLWQGLKTRYDESTFCVVVSGDLTRSGSSYQFGLAHRYLLSKWSKGAIKLGLNCPAEELFCVPGKYDLAPPRRPNRRIIHAHFGEFPSVQRMVDESDDLEVQLIGLDACSGVQSHKLQDVADFEGAFPKGHLKLAQRRLQRLEKDRRVKTRVRIVVMHIPSAGLSHRQLERFRQWATRNEIQAVFSGYHHESTVIDNNEYRHGWKAMVEFWCGTTLKAGTVDLLPGPETNHFRLHKLERINGQIRWSSMEYFHRDTWQQGSVTFSRDLDP